MSNDIVNSNYPFSDEIANIIEGAKIQDLDLIKEQSIKFPLDEIVSLGVSFNPIVLAIQSLVSEPGKSGIYYVNTHGKQMFQKKGTANFIGGLKNEAGLVGGGQADIVSIPIDPTMLMISAVIMTVNHKLDAISETQEKILSFLEQKEISEIKGDIDTLYGIVKDFKFNWDNEPFKENKRNLVQNIKRDSAAKINFYSNNISDIINNKKHLIKNNTVKKMTSELGSNLRNYQLSLYIFSFSYFLEVLLLENFNTDYIESVKSEIENLSFNYRKLYTDAYTCIENYLESSVKNNLYKSLSETGNALGKAVSKIPIINKSSLDENLIESASVLKEFSEYKIIKSLEPLSQTKNSVIRPFISSLDSIKMLSQENTEYLTDGKDLYVIPKLA